MSSEEGKSPDLVRRAAARLSGAAERKGAAYPRQQPGSRHGSISRAGRRPSARRGAYPREADRSSGEPVARASRQRSARRAWLPMVYLAPLCGLRADGRGIPHHQAPYSGECVSFASRAPVAIQPRDHRSPRPSQAMAKDLHGDQSGPSRSPSSAISRSLLVDATTCTASRCAAMLGITSGTGMDRFLSDQKLTFSDVRSTRTFRI